MLLADIENDSVQTHKIQNWVDAASACDAWSCRARAVTAKGGTFFMVTRNQVVSHGKLEVQSRCMTLVERMSSTRAYSICFLRGEPIMSVSRLVGSDFEVIEEEEKYISPNRVESFIFVRLLWEFQSLEGSKPDG